MQRKLADVPLTDNRMATMQAATIRLMANVENIGIAVIKYDNIRFPFGLASLLEKTSWKCAVDKAQKNINDELTTLCVLQRSMSKNKVEMSEQFKQILKSCQENANKVCHMNFFIQKSTIVDLMKKVITSCDDIQQCMLVKGYQSLKGADEKQNSNSISL